MCLTRSCSSEMLPHLTPPLPMRNRGSDLKSRLSRSMSCLNSPLSPETRAYEVNQNAVDIYGLEEFKSLFERAITDNNYLYIVQVTDSLDSKHSYEAYSFFVDQHKNGDLQVNPQTGLPITDYTLYKAKKLARDKISCTQVFTKKEMEQDLAIFRLPVLWNSSGCSLHNKRIFMMLYVRAVEKSNPLEAVRVATQAAKLGSIDAKYYLSDYHWNNFAPELSRLWLGEALKNDPNPAVHNLMLHVFHLVQSEKFDEAFTFAKPAAEQGSLWGVVQLLIHLEERINCFEQAQQWREKLPENLRTASIDAILAFLTNANYPLGHTGLYSPEAEAGPSSE